MTAPAHAFEVDEVGLGIQALYIRLGLGLGLSLQFSNGWSIQATRGNAAVLQSAAVEAWAVIIETLTDYLATADDDTAVAVMEGRQSSLLDTEREIIVGLHFDS